MSYIINNENAGSEYIITIEVPFSNNSTTKFTIYSDNDHDYIDLLCDFAADHDEKINRDTHTSLTLTEDEIAEYEKDGSIDDYICGGNCGTYLNFVIMRDAVTIENNLLELVDQVNFPTWAICALVNGDFSSLNGEGIKQINDFKNEQIEACSIYSNTDLAPIYHFIDDEQPNFESRPAFGLACDCVQLYVLKMRS